jgi:hypothetical protein
MIGPTFALVRCSISRVAGVIPIRSGGRRPKSRKLQVPAAALTEGHQPVSRSADTSIYLIDEVPIGSCSAKLGGRPR